MKNVPDVLVQRIVWPSPIIKTHIRFGQTRGLNKITELSIICPFTKVKIIELITSNISLSFTFVSIREGKTLGLLKRSYPSTNRTFCDFKLS